MGLVLKPLQDKKETLYVLPNPRDPGALEPYQSAV